MPAAPRSQFESIVASNTPLCREHFRLTLTLTSFPPTEPGQFVQISCNPMDDIDDEPEHQLDWPADRLPRATNRQLCQPTAMLRRPFSLAGRRDLPTGDVEIDIIHRVVGVGTGWLSHLKPGDVVHLLGPLGNRFALPAPGETALLVGGGVGIPPMLYLAARLAGRPAAAFCGALCRDLLPFTLLDAPASVDDVRPSMIAGEFAEHGIPAVLTTDDGSFGFRGFVTQALERYLDAGLAANPVIYTCGPEPMMKRVAEIAAARGLACQIAVERAMACGMGTCQSCVIRVRRQPTNGRDWAYRLACTDGPIFKGEELLW